MQPTQALLPKRQLMQRQLAYNFGRIATYVSLGWLIAWVGQWALWFDGVLPMQKAIFLTANLILILIGIQMVRSQTWPTWLESAGYWIWKPIQPVAARALKQPSFPIVSGALWGLLPCGMLYSMLAVAIAIADPARAALWMLAFGLGTLPNLLAMGFFAARLRQWQRHVVFRWITSGLLLGMGLFGILKTFELLPDFVPQMFCLPAA